MSKYAIIPSFQWAASSTPSSSFRLPTVTSGKLVLLVESDFAKAPPLKSDSLMALSQGDRKWLAKLKEYLDFIDAHDGRHPWRKSADAAENSLAEWWRIQADNFKEGKLSEFRVERLIEEGLLVLKSPG